MAKYPKKPKLNSLPKRPKNSAPASTWENYEKKCKEVQKNNRKKLEDWKKAKKAVDSGTKKRALIIKKTQGIGRI